jgi:elongation factor 3
LRAQLFNGARLLTVDVFLGTCHHRFSGLFVFATRNIDIDLSLHRTAKVSPAHTALQMNSYEATFRFLEMPAVSATPTVTVPAPPLKATLTSTPDDGPFDISALFVAEKSTRDSAARSLAALAENDGLAALTSIEFQQAVVKALADKKSPAAREGAANSIVFLAKSGAVKALEPTFVDSGIYASLLETFADKMPAVRTAAVEAVREYVAAMSPWATALLLPALLREIKSAGKWQVKTGCLVILNQLVQSAPIQTARLMPDIVPVLSEAIWDTKADVKKAARDSLTKATALVSNKDIERFIPALIKALINPVEEVPNTITLLSATTFVSEVDSPTLSLMVPLLSRGLNEKLTATKRKVAVYVSFCLSPNSPS